jgi:hypothetical protein
MGVAACLVSLLLALLGLVVDLSSGTPFPNAGSEQILTIQIRPDEPDSEPEPAPAKQSAELQLPEDRSLEEETSVSPPESPLDAQRAINWREAITETVAEFVNEDVRQEESRAHMWRQNYSVMFQPADEIGLTEPDPVIPDFRFKPEIHVVGIGVTIGSCFFGLPILGVPVEDRTVAIRLFVCAKDST